MTAPIVVHPHGGPYPHEGGCPECRDARVCDACGTSVRFGVGSTRCTNGRCGACHNRYCTGGGAVDTGHGYWRQEIMRAP
jgi:hypothetical protein